MSTNVCVESTVRDGFMRDYYMVILQDCVSSSVPEAHEPSLKNLSRYFASLSSGDALGECWKSAIANAQTTPAS